MKLLLELQLPSDPDGILMNKQVEHHLELSNLEPNFKLARQLPPDLAIRYHALPVGKDGDRLTVAMADPNDTKARDAIMNSLGKSTCLVQADVNAIDRLLADLWHESFNHSLDFLTWLPPDSIRKVVKLYAQNLSDLLGARLSHFETSMSIRSIYKDLVEETKIVSADMVIYRAPSQALIKRLVGGSVEHMLIKLLPVSSLLVHGFRWPINKILLVIRNDESDETALNWTINLAKSSGAFVTVLPISIPVPSIYASIQPDIPTLLKTDCPMGRKMRWVARRLADWEIEGTLQLRNELPIDQIRCETREGNHDLIVIAAETQNWLRYRVFGELIAPLISWTDIPLLIAKPRRISKEEQ